MGCSHSRGELSVNFCSLTLNTEAFFASLESLSCHSYQLLKLFYFVICR